MCTYAQGLSDTSLMTVFYIMSMESNIAEFWMEWCLLTSHM